MQEHISLRMPARLPNKGHAKLLRSAVLALAVAAAATPFPARACGQEAPWAAGRLQEKIRAGSSKVRGIFRIKPIERAASDEVGLDEDTTLIVYGTVTAQDGRTYQTSHKASDSFLFCPATCRPDSDSAGAFYLSRQPDANGRYLQRDYSGEPLLQPRQQEQDK
jgi:hypothetical protein